MALKKQEKTGRIKEFGFKRFLKSFKNSMDGLINAYKNEQSLYIHAVSSILVIAVGMFLKISFSEWAILLISLAVVLTLELVNTAIEAVVDLITTEWHILAKIAKDSGSAATFVASLATAVICAFIFIPKIIVLFN